LLFSAVLGYVSYRQEQFGSHFIHFLVETFREEAHRQDINALMTLVSLF